MTAIMGVAGLLAAHPAGFTVDLRLPAILLGGSVVGLDTQSERLLAGQSEAYLLIWKTLFVTVGFATAWFIITLAWGGIALGLTALGVMTVLPRFKNSSRQHSNGLERLQRLKEQLKGCC